MASPQQAQQHHLLLQRLLSTGPMVSGKSRLKRARLAVPASTTFPLIDQGLHQPGEDRRDRGAVFGRLASGMSPSNGGTRQGAGPRWPADPAAQIGQRVLADRLGQLHRTLLDPPGVGDEDQQHASGPQRHELDVADRGADQRGVPGRRRLAVTCASKRTVRLTTSSRSTAPSRKVWMARRSGADSGLTVESRSTKSR